MEDDNILELGPPAHPATLVTTPPPTMVSLLGLGRGDVLPGLDLSYLLTFGGLESNSMRSGENLSMAGASYLTADICLLFVYQEGYPPILTN